MTDNAGSYPPQYNDPQAQSTTDVAREQAANVGQSVSDAGGHVAQTATDQAKQVAAETARQARDLMGEATGQVRDQASVQQQRAAQQLHSVADELHEMAAKGGQSGLATEVAQQAAERLRGAASWLESREPTDLLTGIRDFARRRPGAFLAGAAIAGLVAGRLTRGITAAARSGNQPGQPGQTRRELSPGITPGLAGTTAPVNDLAYQPGDLPGSSLPPAGDSPDAAYGSAGFQDPAYQRDPGMGTIGGTEPAGTGLPSEEVMYTESSTFAEGSAFPEGSGTSPVPGYVAGDVPEEGTDPETRAYPQARGYPQGRLDPETGEDELGRP